MKTMYPIIPLTINQNDQLNTENNTILNSNNNTNMPISGPNNNVPIISLMNQNDWMSTITPLMNQNDWINTENTNSINNDNVPSIYQCIDIIKSSSLLSTPLHQHPSTKVFQERFNNFICNHSVYHCYYCKERCYNLKSKYDDNKFQYNKYINNSNKNTIQICTLSTQSNLDLKIELIYHLLPKLNDIK